MFGAQIQVSRENYEALTARQRKVLGDMARAALQSFVVEAVICREAVVRVDFVTGYAVGPRGAVRRLAEGRGV